MYKKGLWNAFARKLAVFEHLRSRRYPIALDELADHFKVSTKTVRRDLKDIERAGQNLAFTYDDGDCARTLVRLLSRDYIDVALTRAEAHILAGTRRLWAPFAGTVLHDAMENIYTKIVENLPVPEREEIERDAQRFYFIPDPGLRDYAPRREYVDTLQKAVMRRRRLRFTYRALRGQSFSGAMDPHALVIYKNTIYVLARRCQPLSAERRAEPALQWIRWPADRFEALELLPEQFEVAPDFRIEEHFDGFGIMREDGVERVTIDFDQDVSGLIAERVWHKTQALSPLPDGWTRLTFQTSNLKEVQAWIHSFAGHAAVREPAWLAESVRAQQAEAVALADERPPFASEADTDRGEAIEASSAPRHEPEDDDE